MKISAKLFLSFLLIFNLLSCSNNEEKSVEKDLINEEVKKETLERSSMESRYVLFNFNNNSELESKLPKALTDVSNANHFELTARTVANCEKISSKVKIIDGQALFYQYRYLDINNNILKLYEFNTIENQYVEVPNTSTYNEPVTNGGCPQGTTFINNCEYGIGLQSCISVHTSLFVMDALEENSGAIVTLTNSLNGVIICGTAVK